MTNTYSVYTLDTKPHLQNQVKELGKITWPEFMHHGNDKHWHYLYTKFLNFQIALCDSDEKVIACGHTVPFNWNGDINNLPINIEEILTNASKNSESNTIVALAAIISKDWQGKGLSGKILQHMKKLGSDNNFKYLIVPVRPTWKSRYPLTPIENYAKWTTQAGLPYDPWLRTHFKIGGKVLKVAKNTLTVKGTVIEWESWTNMIFPESGQYVVKGALQPINIDVEKNIGIYEDPNIWVKHDI